MTQPTGVQQAFDSRILAGRIQHTLFRIGVGEADIARHCSECVEFGFSAAMVPGRWVALTARLLSGTAVAVASAVDFPHGLMSPAGRVREATAIVEAGAAEIDLAVPIGLLLDGDTRGFRDSIFSVVSAIDPVPVKVMLELPLLTQRQRNLAVDLAVDAGAGWLKNASSGDIGIASPAEMRYLRQRAPAHVHIKASGGITSARQAAELLQAGAEALGTSSGPQLVSAGIASGDYTGRTHPSAADAPGYEKA